MRIFIITILSLITNSSLDFYAELSANKVSNLSENTIKKDSISYPSLLDFKKDLKLWGQKDCTFNDILDGEKFFKYDTFLVDNYYIAFFPNKRLFAQSNFQQSAIIIYKRNGSSWKTDTLSSFYYDLKRLKSDCPYFESNNQGRLMQYDETGYFYSILRFENGRFKMLKEFSGFDKYASIDRQFSEGKKIDTQINDTITHTFSVTDYFWNDKKLIGFNVKETIVILKNISDSVATKKNTIIKRIEIKN